jgi:predicted nucleotidyltransferase component of viral defense system
MALNHSIHRNILIKILKDVYSHPTTAPLLGFKGGTAAYLFYDLPRFSVDLDFDLFEADKEDLVFTTVLDILHSYGVVKEAHNKRFSLLYILSYDGKTTGAQNVKVEINKRTFGSEYEVKSYLGISMSVMIMRDMLAHKLVAMTERLGTTNRDIFDVWFFLQNNWPINREIVERRTRLPFADFLQHCIEKLEVMSNQNLLAGMGELLDQKQKSWVKEKLRTETIFLLQLLLDSSSRDS